jgi:hypothetical protein
MEKGVYFASRSENSHVNVFLKKGGRWMGDLPIATASPSGSILQRASLRLLLGRCKLEPIARSALKAIAATAHRPNEMGLFAR